MRIGSPDHRTVLILGVVFVCAWSMVSPAFGATTGSLSVRVAVDDFSIIDGDDGQRVRAEGFGVMGESGRPDLPGKIFPIAVPPGAEVVSVSIESAEPVSIEGNFEILPVALTRVLGDEDPEIAAAWLEKWREARAATYGSDRPYPEEPVELVGDGAFRRYQLAEVKVAPFRYHPATGALEYYPELTIRVDYSLDESPAPVVHDHVPRFEVRARELIANYDQAQEWYEQGSTAPLESTHELVIITTDALVESVRVLVDHETSKGRSPVVVTVETIEATITAVDRAAAIRIFLRDVYQSSVWGVEDVLLVGAPVHVPMREVCFDLGYGRPRTDFYYAELSETDEDSWDSDGDGCYGEETDDQIDLYSEVNVGRIPWSLTGVVESVGRKSAAFERNNDPAYKRNILVMGAYFWDDTDTAHLMEAKLDQPWMSDWTVTRMYEQNASYWSSFACDLPLDHSNSISTWSANTYGFVNWAGHGSPTSAHTLGNSGQAFVHTSDCVLLDDTHPAIVWSDSCSTANPAGQNLAREFIRHGAVGFVGATAVALGAPAWTGPLGGSSQSCDYWFTTKVTSGEMTQGEAHQWALLQNYIYGLWSLPKYEVFEWTLHGSPTLGMGVVDFPGDVFSDDFESGDTSRWSAMNP